MSLQTNCFRIFLIANAVAIGYNDLEIIFLSYKQFYRLRTQRCKSMKYVCYDYKYFK